MGNDNNIMKLSSFGYMVLPQRLIVKKQYMIAYNIKEYSRKISPYKGNLNSRDASRAKKRKEDSEPRQTSIKLEMTKVRAQQLEDEQ